MQRNLENLKKIRMCAYDLTVYADEYDLFSVHNTVFFAVVDVQENPGRSPTDKCLAVYSIFTYTVAVDRK